MKKNILVMMSIVLLFALIGCTSSVNENQGVIEQGSESEKTSNNESFDTGTNETDEESTELESEDVDKVELSLEEIINQMYEHTGLEFPMMGKSELTLENMIYMLGVDNFEYLEGVTSEPMMSSQAHSIVLFTVDENADIDKIKKDIKENVDGRKWICVEVEEKNILVEHVGNHIVLIMDVESELLREAFLQIMK